MGSLGFPELAVIFGCLVLIIWPTGRICRRIGFSPWLGVLAAVPLVNLFLLWFIAFSQWPKQPSAQGGA